MQLPLHFNGRLSPTAFFFLLFSVLGIAIAAPVPQSSSGVKALTARGTQISLEEYIAYLQKYYPDTDKYLEYSGNSLDQLLAFRAANPGYYYYNDFFDSETSAYFNEAFPPSDEREDDGEESSKAISMVATKQIYVFGAADYQTLGLGSYYATCEAKPNLEGVQSGRLQFINHMAKDATSPSQVMATEDGDGKFTYQPGYTPGTPNNSDLPGSDSDSSDSSSESGQPYGDPATQETPGGGTETTQDPASSGGDSISDTSGTTDPATIGEDPDIHI